MDRLRFTHSSCGHNQQADYSATSISFRACWVFSCFCNPVFPPHSESDIDYRILFNVRALTCMHIYIWGLGTPRASQYIFDSEKLISFSCAPHDLRVSQVIESSVWRSTNKYSKVILLLWFRVLNLKATFTHRTFKSDSSDTNVCFLGQIEKKLWYF